MPDYKVTKEGVVAYPLLVRVQAWAFTIVVAAVIVSGLFVFRLWLYETFGVYGGVYVPTPPYVETVHLYSGFAFVGLGLLHIVLHIAKKEKPLLPISTISDFGDFLHSGIWLLFMTRKEVRGKEELYNGRQRITYIAFLYISGLAAITSFLLYFHLLGHDYIFVHVLPAGLAFMVVLMQFLIVIKKHDVVGMKSLYITGVLPIDYVRKKKPMLYQQVKDSVGRSE